MADSTRRSILFYRPCATCRTGFYAAERKVKIGNGLFCSRVCASRGKTLGLPRGKPHTCRTVTRICETCKTEFQAGMTNVRLGRCRFCSHTCARAKYRLPRTTLICRCCKTEFQTHRPEKRVYCSRACAAYRPPKPAKLKLPKPAAAPLSEVACRQCNTIFRPKRPDRATCCSRRCGGLYGVAQKLAQSSPLLCAA